MAKNRRSSRGTIPPGGRKTGTWARVPKESAPFVAPSAARDAGIVAEIRKRRAREIPAIGEQALPVIASDMGILFSLDIASLAVALENGLPVDDALIDLVEGGSPTPRQLRGHAGAALATIQSVIDGFIQAMLIRIVDRLKAGASMTEALEGQAKEVMEVTRQGRA